MSQTSDFNLHTLFAFFHALVWRRRPSCYEAAPADVTVHDEIDDGAPC